jgi:DNA-binding transcriptional regulator YdaS (Cro superfamily)
MDPVTQETSPELALKLAIKRAGSATRLAKALGVSLPAISRWRVCPVPRVLAVEALTGIRRELLRPDIYPAE